MIGRVALLVTFKKAKPKSQSLSRSHIRDLGLIMKRLGVILTFTLFSTNLISQSTCSCDDLEQGFEKPDTLFQIGEKSIAICNGYYENGFVSEFSLIACGDTSISKFYDATLEYKIELANDTLYLGE